MLRLLNEADAEAMHEWMHDENVVKDLFTDFGSKTLDDCRAFISASHTDKRNIHLAITDDENEYLGTVSLKNIKDFTAEFGIVLRTSSMGKGYAKKAMMEMLNKGFYEYTLKSVYWCVDPANTRAIKFYDKNGYKRVPADALNDIQLKYTISDITRFIWYRVTKEEI